MFHHHSKDADDHLGAGSEENLPLATLLCIADGLKGISQHIHSHQLGNLGWG